MHVLPCQLSRRIRTAKATTKIRPHKSADEKTYPNGQVCNWHKIPFSLRHTHSRGGRKQTCAILKNTKEFGLLRREKPFQRNTYSHRHSLKSDRRNIYRASFIKDIHVFVVVCSRAIRGKGQGKGGKSVGSERAGMSRCLIRLKYNEHKHPRRLRRQEGVKKYRGRRDRATGRIYAHCIWAHSRKNEGLRTSSARADMKVVAQATLSSRT